MSPSAKVESWLRDNRTVLWIAWDLIGTIVVVALVLGPDEYVLRNAAPLSRLWAILIFASLWGWVALRFIVLWIWAWVVMALAPLFLFIALRYHLDAWWLTPLLVAIVVVSALTVAVVVWWELRRRRAAAEAPPA